MSGFDNEVLYSIGERLEASTSQAIQIMQKTATDVSNINHTGNPEGVVSANPSSLSHDPVSGAVYIKNTGTGNTGWAQILDSSSGVLPVPKGGTGDSSFTAYSVITGGTTSTGALQNVSGVGTTGQILTSNGASALPTWQSASSGALVLLGSFDLSGLSSQAFVSMMSSTYRNYLLKICNLYMSGSNRPRMVISQDNGATYLGGTGYAFFYGTMFGGSGFVSTGGGGQDSFYLSNNMQDSNNQPEASFDIEFFSGLGSNGFTYHGKGMQNDPVSGLAYNLPWGFYQNLSPEINAIKLITESGTFQAGFASLYGYAK